MSLAEQRRVGMRVGSRPNCCGPPDVMLLQPPASCLLGAKASQDATDPFSYQRGGACRSTEEGRHEQEYQGKPQLRVSRLTLIGGSYWAAEKKNEHGLGARYTSH